MKPNQKQFKKAVDEKFRDEKMQKYIDRIDNQTKLIKKETMQIKIASTIMLVFSILLAINIIIFVYSIFSDIKEAGATEISASVSKNACNMCLEECNKLK